jgi:hypothetical protein
VSPLLLLLALRNVDDGLGKGLRSFLRQIVPDAARDGPVLVLAGEFSIDVPAPTRNRREKSAPSSSDRFFVGARHGTSAAKSRVSQAPKYQALPVNYGLFQRDRPDPLPKNPNHVTVKT